MDTVLKTPMLRLLLVASLLVLAASWVFSLPITSSYPDLVTARGYYADPEGREDIASVQGRTFTPFTGPLFRGNDARPLWLRLTLAPSTRPDWVVLFQPNTIRDIETWIPAPDGSWRREVTGIRHAFSDREVATLSPAVAVTPSPDRAITIYARVRTPTTPLYARVITRDDSADFDALLSLSAGMFSGLGFIMLMISLLAYAATRDALWGLDALFNLSGLIAMTLVLGLAARLIAPGQAGLFDQLDPIIKCCHLAVSVVLYLALFRLFNLPRWVRLPFMLTLALLPVQLWLIARGHADQALALNNLLIGVLNVLALVVALLACHPDTLILNVFRVAYAGAALYILAWALSINLQLQSGNLTTLYPLMPSSLLTMLVLMVILARNTQLKLLTAQRLVRAKREVEQRLYYEQKQHADTHGFLGMLLHEIKNPLSAIRMTTSNLESELAGLGESVRLRLRRVHQAVDDVDEVLERGVEIDSLEQGALVLAPATVNVAALVEESCAGHPASLRLRPRGPAALLAGVDVHLFGLMLRNLLDNAIKYSPEGSSVDVVVAAGENSTWSLTVRNLVGAAGFPDAGQVFRKYYRSPLAMRRSGMGLGLYWVSGVARRMGGDISYARDGNDVVFRLCLPI